MNVYVRSFCDILQVVSVMHSLAKVTVFPLTSISHYAIPVYLNKLLDIFGSV